VFSLSGTETIIIFLTLSRFIPSVPSLSPFGKELYREFHLSVSNQHSCIGLLTFQCLINSIIISSKLLSFPFEAISSPLIFLSST